MIYKLAVLENFHENDFDFGAGTRVPTPQWHTNFVANYLDTNRMFEDVVPRQMALSRLALVIRPCDSMRR